jgi:hypothetical protein
MRPALRDAAALSCSVVCGGADLSSDVFHPESTAGRRLADVLAGNLSGVGGDGYVNKEGEPA